MTENAFLHIKTYLVIFITVLSFIIIVSLIRTDIYSTDKLLNKISKHAIISYYELTAKDLTDLSSLKVAIKNIDLRDHFGNNCLALTSWNILPNNQLELAVKLPKFKQYKDIDINLINYWPKLYHAILEHELGHVQAALNIKKELTRKSTTKHARKSLAAKLYNSDLVYDQRTFNGRTQGVRLRRG